MTIEKNSWMLDFEQGVQKDMANTSSAKEEEHPKNASSQIMDWIVDIDSTVDDLNPQSEERRWSGLCIYKVPAFARDLNPKAFTPQLVSLGPYHHGKGNLELMEVHKKRALTHFLKRSNRRLNKVVNAVEDELQVLMDSYYRLGDEWTKDRSRFLKLMITDGCFMLELLQFTTSKDDMGHYRYSLKDPFFSEHGIHHNKPYFIRDMLMIENQLPLLLLKKLMVVQNSANAVVDDNEIHELVLKFLGRSTGHMSLMNLRDHALDLYRESLLFKVPVPVTQDNRPHTKSPETGFTVPTAMELKESGVTIVKSTSSSILDVHFNPKNGVLKLPHLIVDDSTECMFFNIIAFEHLHPNVRHDFSSYVSFMAEIIDSAADVNHLHSKRILQNALGSSEAAAELFSKISKEVTIDSENFLKPVREDIHRYCRKRLNRWMANLLHNYFSSPWSALSLAAAMLLIVLTLCQTVYAVMQYHHGSN